MKFTAAPNRASRRRFAMHCWPIWFARDGTTDHSLVTVFGEQCPGLDGRITPLYAKDRVNEEVIFRREKNSKRSAPQPDHFVLPSTIPSCARQATRLTIPGAAYRKDPLASF